MATIDLRGSVPRIEDARANVFQAREAFKRSRTYLNAVWRQNAIRDFNRSAEINRAAWVVIEGDDCLRKGD